jgi:hypothetical protein
MKKTVGCQEIRCHWIFDVKMDGFARKHRMVAGGHTTKAPKTLIYASVVSKERSNCLDHGGPEKA